MRTADALFSTGDPAYAVNRDGVIQAWNRTAEDAFGYSMSDALNQRCWELLAGQDLFGNRYCCEGCPLREIAFDHRSVNSNEMRFIVADGKLRRFRVTRLLVACDSENELLVHLCYPQSEPDDGSIPVAKGRKSDISSMRGALTIREAEVLNLLSQGKTTRQLASELNISPATVRNHIQNIFCKLKVHTRLEAVCKAQRMGLLEDVHDPESLWAKVR